MKLFIIRGYSLAIDSIYSTYEHTVCKMQKQAVYKELYSARMEMCWECAMEVHVCVRNSKRNSTFNTKILTIQESPQD